MEHHELSIISNFYYYLFIFASLIVLLRFFKPNKYKIFVLLVLSFFVFAHVSPDRLIASDHHDINDHTQLHPCCFPQTNEIIVPEIVPPKNSYKITQIIFIDDSNLLFLHHKPNNKSPPHS